MIPVSAPGKAFLIGEYAVLEGAPALVAALDPSPSLRAPMVKPPVSTTGGGSIDSAPRASR